ncbi:MAG: hypothetical protein L6R40_007246 [Gallowayella cf. fulva]|nr:MAG: hypothetical protein L6R40_007246 [Xanthomendoza cf. fulva]
MASSRTDPDCVPILQYLWNHGDERTDDSYFEDRPELQAWTHHGNGTPLYNAASSGNKEAVEWLLLHGADPGKRTKCRDRVGDLPIDAAIHKNHTDVVEMLTQVTVVTPEQYRKKKQAHISPPVKQRSSHDSYTVDSAKAKEHHAELTPLDEKMQKMLEEQ